MAITSKTGIKAIRFAARRFEINEHRSCSILRMLSKNPELTSNIAQALTNKINSGTLGPKDLFSFDIAVIRSVISEADPKALAILASSIRRGSSLPLWIDKKCYFEPLTTGMARILFVYYLMPENKKGPFLKQLSSKSSFIYDNLLHTIRTNPMLKFENTDKDRAKSVLSIVKQWDIAGPKAFTRRARYNRMKHPPRKHVVG